VNPWAGILGGPALVLLGMLTLRDPNRLSKLSDSGFRIAYQFASAEYEGSRAHRFTIAVTRIGGVIAIVLGSGLFVAGLALLIAE
jgi:hypothetical protein